MPSPEPNTRIQLERALQKALLDLLKSQKKLQDFTSTSGDQSYATESPKQDILEFPLTGNRLPVDFLKTVLAASGEGICVTDTQGRILFCNMTIHRVLGYRLNELIGKSLHEAIYLHQPDGQPSLPDQDPLLKSLQKGEALHNREGMLIRKDGSLIEVSYTAAPITTQGEMLGLILTFHDITARRAEERFVASTLQATTQANQELRKSIERHKVIAEFSKQALSGSKLITLLAHTVSVISKTLKVKFCKIMEQSVQEPEKLVILAVTGFPPELVGQSVKFTDEAQAAYTLRKCESVMSLDFRQESRFTPSACHADYGLISGLSVIIHGNEKPFGVLEVSTQEERAFDDDEVQFLQALANILGIVVDRKHAELARTESEKKYAAMVREAAVGIGQVSPLGMWQDANRKLCEILGYSLEELKHMDCQQVTYPEDVADDHAMFLRLAAGEFDSYSVEKRYLRKDGSVIWAHLTASSVRDEQSRLLYIIGMVDDITLRKKNQKDLEASRKALEESNRELEQFATVASHDLKAPLRKIETFSTYLSSQAADKLNSEEQDYLRRIQGCVQSMRTLVDDLLFLARASKEAPMLGCVELSKVVQEALGNLSTQIEEQHAIINIGPLGLVEGDGTQLKQLFQNLIQNALKFQPPGNRPEVSIFIEQPEPDWCNIFVKDNGIGFPEDQAERLFKPFERLEGRQAYAGTGIGLSICKRIVERHQGSIRVCSQPGAGSTFIIRLPIRQARQNAI